MAFAAAERAVVFLYRHNLAASTGTEHRSSSDARVGRSPTSEPGCERVCRGAAARVHSCSSPTVPKRSATTSWIWIVSKLHRPEQEVVIGELQQGLEIRAVRSAPSPRRIGAQVRVLDDPVARRSAPEVVDGSAPSTRGDLDQHLGVDITSVPTKSVFRSSLVCVAIWTSSRIPLISSE